MMIYFLVFLSGTIALGFEILWLRGFAIVLGSTSYALSCVITVFMLGLALGYFTAGYLSKYTRGRIHPLMAYLAVELAGILLGSASVYVLFFHQEILNGWSSVLILNHLLICSATMLVPCVLMGMNLPILSQLLSQKVCIDRLYAWNTLGGGFGCLLFGFAVIPWLGYDGSLFAMAAAGLSLIIPTLLLKRRGPGTSFMPVAQAMPEKLEYGLVWAAVSGAVLMSYEVLWERVLSILIGDRAYVANLVLFIIILNLGLGAIFYRRYRNRISSLVAAALAVAIVSSLLGFLIQGDALPSEPPRVGFKLLYLSLAVIIPGLALGIFFPWTLDQQTTPKRIGMALGLNTLAGSVGALTTSYLLIQALGVNRSVLLICFFLLSILCFFLWRAGGRKRIAAVAAGFFIFAYLLDRPMTIDNRSVIAQREDAQGHFSILQGDASPLLFSGNLRIVAPLDHPATLYVQNGLAFYASLFVPEVKHALVMGMGYGITVGAFPLAGAEKTTAVELMQGVIDAASMFGRINYAFYNNPSVEIVRDDARQVLRSRDGQYDVISTNTTSPYSASGALFYSREFYELVAQRLSPHGVFTQLLWGQHMPEIVHTMKTVFPYLAALPGYDDSNLLIVGSRQPLRSIARAPKSYGREWPKYENMNWDALQTAGQAILERTLSAKPRFVISDKKADLAYARAKHLGWFYINRRM